MEYIVVTILMVIWALVARKFYNSGRVDLHEEKAEVQANLQTTLEALEQFDEEVKEELPKKKVSKRPIRLLKKIIESKKHALQNTLEKVELEGERNWEYRKLQAERTMEAAQNVMNSEELKHSVDKA